jgi:hypothetical protein
MSELIIGYVCLISMLRIMLIPFLHSTLEADVPKNNIGWICADFSHPSNSK